MSVENFIVLYDIGIKLSRPGILKSTLT